MDNVHWIKIALNTGTILVLIILLCILQFNLKPFQSGFYCNDYSINMKYYKSTVNNEVLVFVSSSFGFLAIFISEFVNKTQFKFNRLFTAHRGSLNSFKIQLANNRIIEIKEYIGNVYINYGFYVTGMLLNTIVTLVGKKTIGRLRPNFLDVCKPDINPYIICGQIHLTGKTYLIPGVDFQCTSIDKAGIEESQLSFPSGHSSTSFYTAVFLVFYLNRMWKRRSCSLFLHITQIFIICCAFVVAMTRIIDNKHHVTDVFAGIGIGSFTALITFYYLDQFYKKSEISINTNSRQLAFKKSDSFRTNSETDVFIDHKIV